MFKSNILYKLRFPLLFATLFYGCSEDYLEPAPIRQSEGFHLTMGGPLTRSVQSDAILDQMRFYCFAQSGSPLTGGGGSWQSPFHHQIAGITRSGMTLTTTQMQAGDWDMVMVSGAGATFTPPMVAKKAEELLMYTYNPGTVQADGSRAKAHEIWHRMRRLPSIVANANHTDACAITRNVAMVKVVVERAVDVSTATTDNTIALHNVPDKISWAGTLLRTVSPGVYATTTAAPDTLAAPLTGKLTFTNNGSVEAGTFKSDTLTFIIPAHREKDFWTDASTQKINVTDTITHRMNLSVSFAKASAGRYNKTVQIPVVAKCNQILILKVKMKDVNIEIKPEVLVWDTQSVNGDMKAPYLNVSNVETTVYDGAVSRIHFWSNQPADSIFVTKIGKNGGATLPDVDTQLDHVVGTMAVNRHYETATQMGYIDIANLNLAASQPDVKIYLKAGGLQREITVKRQVSAQALANITTPYVGTFHRWNQTGERIVTWKNTGEWTATIDNPTGAGAEVLIDRLSSPEMQDGSLYGATPGNAELYKVSGDARSVTGQNTVYFRVGWKSSAPSAVQPRYATITVTTTTGTKKLYLRQGEAADYLMRISDAINSGGMSNTTRPDARKFTPYNLTDPNMGAGGGAANTYNQLTIPAPIGENRFTAYPTQAGAFFQWAGASGYERRAYHPTKAITGWSAGYASGYWNALDDNHQTCPAGYRRPNDGTTGATNSTGAVTDSEMRQSLYAKPNTGNVGTSDNSVWGYYADGFFDRIEIGASVTGVANTAVFSTTKDVAYVGRLFFNPNNNASIFFPAAGLRKQDTGTPDLTGSNGSYWSSSVFSAANAWFMNISNSYANQAENYRSSGYNVRCVVTELSATPQIVTLSGSAGNTQKSIVINSPSAWTITGLPANASVSPTSGGPGATTVVLTRNNVAYGNHTMTVTNADGRVENVKVESLYITPDELWLNNNLPGTNTNEFDIIAWGGSEDWKIVPGSYPAWLTVTKLPNGKLRLSAQQYTLSDERIGTVTFSHADDPAYTTTFTVIQMVFSDIPPFQYFVTKVTWGANDVDIAVEFSGNYLVNAAGQPTTTHVPFDNRAVGWSLTCGLYYNGSVITQPNYTQTQLQDGLMFWGGDATQGQGETVYFNSPLITPAPGDYRNDRSGLPRKININVFTTWFFGDGDVTVNVSTYEGGVMVKPSGPGTGSINSFNFYNVDDYTVAPAVGNIRPASFSETKTKNLMGKGSPANYRTTYNLFCTITYDRWTRKAAIDWNPVAPFSFGRGGLPNTYTPTVKK